MLISEMKGWYYAITWDNAEPPNSSAMIKSLSELGKLISTQTKTTVVLAPKANTGWRDIRHTIINNLNNKKGNAVYVNLRSGKMFQIGSKTKWHWKQVS